MDSAGVFKSNKTQAVRLPKALAFPESVTRVDVAMIGRTRVIAPAGELWDSWFDAPLGETVTSDFMDSRDQPDDQERERL